MYSSLVNRTQSSEQGRAHACVCVRQRERGGEREREEEEREREREVEGGKYMLMKTFIFHDFGH